MAYKNYVSDQILGTDLSSAVQLYVTTGETGSGTATAVTAFVRASTSSAKNSAGTYTLRVWSGGSWHTGTFTITGNSSWGDNYTFKEFQATITIGAGFDVNSITHVQADAMSPYPNFLVKQLGLYLTYTTTPTYTACGAPTAVTGGNAAATPSTTYPISWSGQTAGSGIKGFNIYKNGVNFKYVDGASASSTSITSPVAGGTDKYTVQTASSISDTYNSYQSTASTSFTSVSAPPPGSLPAPGGLTAPTYIGSGTNIAISWNAVTGVTGNSVVGYILEHNTNGGVWTALAAQQTLTASVASATMGNNKGFRVKTLGSASNSGYSATITTTTIRPVVPPATVPTLSGTDVAPGAPVTLSWIAGSGYTENPIASYIIYSNTNGAGWVQQATTLPSVLSLGVNASSVSGGNIQFKIGVTGTRGDTSSTQSPIVILTTQNANAAPTPTSITIDDVAMVYVSGATTKVLKWTVGTPIAGQAAVAGFNVYRDGVKLNSTALGAGVREFSITIMPDAGKNYAYTVRTISNPAGYDSGDSTQAIIYRYGVPGAPTIIMLNSTATTLYVGIINKPTVKLEWQSASAGVYSNIKGYNIYKDGVQIGDTIPNTSSYGSTSVENTANAVYTVRTVDLSDLVSSDSSEVNLVVVAGQAAPNYNGAQPSGVSYNPIKFKWDVVNYAHGDVKYIYGYNTAGNDHILSGEHTALEYDFNVTQYIAAGAYYRFAIKTRVYPAGGGYTDGDFSYSSASTTDLWRASIVVSPEIYNIKDNSSTGNSTYTYNSVYLNFRHTKITNSADILDLKVYYRTTPTGDFNITPVFIKTTPIDATTYETTTTHDISTFGSGIIYYKVEATDVYGQKGFATGSIEKIGAPAISTVTFINSNVPNTNTTLQFTPNYNTHARPLKYSIQFIYAGQIYTTSSGITISQADSSGTTPVIVNPNMAYASIGVLSTLQTEILDRKVTPTITYRIIVEDNQTPAVVGNSATHNGTYIANYRSAPLITGSTFLSLDNGNLAGLGYVNSGDILRIEKGNIAISWLNAAGTTAGAMLTYTIKDHNNNKYVYNQTQWDTFMENGMRDILIEEITSDRILSISLTVEQAYVGSVAISNISTTSLPAKRFIVPKITFYGFQRTEDLKFNTHIKLNDPYRGGSNSVTNVTSISNVSVTDGSTPNIVTATLTQLTTGYFKTGLNISTKEDVIISATATLTLSSGRTIPITNIPFLLKSLGVILALRKARAGINVNPESFLDGVNLPSLVVEGRNEDTNIQVLKLTAGTGNIAGSGIELKHNVTSGIFSLKETASNEAFFSLNRSLTILPGGQAEINAISTNGTSSQLNLHGIDQGSGVIYVGRSGAYGGGMFFEGVTPSTFTHDGAKNKVSLYGRENGVNTVVAEWGYAGGIVHFKATPTVKVDEDVISVSLNGHKHGTYTKQSNELTDLMVFSDMTTTDGIFTGFATRDLLTPVLTAVKAIVINTTLVATTWSSSSYVIENTSFTVDSNQEITPSSTISLIQLKALQKAQIVGSSQGLGSCTIKALGTVPTIDIPITIIIRGY